MKISLIISTFNRKHWLIPLLLKLNDQTFQDFEVIVADDGSSDGTYKIVSSMIQQGRSSYVLKIVKQEDRGFRVASSRNNGARVAQSRQLVFLDDDCLPDNEFLESYVDAFTPDHLLRGDIIFVESFDRLDEVLHIHPGGPDTALWGANFSLATELFWSVGGYSEGFVNEPGEDSDLQIRLWSCGIKTLAVPGAHVYHYGREKAGGEWLMAEDKPVSAEDDQSVG